MYQKLWSDDAQFLRYGARQTDEQTDGQRENVTYILSMYLFAEVTELKIGAV